MVGKNVEIKRLLKNVTTGNRHLRRLVSESEAVSITEAVRRVETTTSAEIKVVIEASLKVGPLFHGQTARDRALEVFSVERVWDTKENNGILLYLLVAEHDAEIVADRGFNEHVRADEWSAVCDALAHDINAVGFVSAMINAVDRLGVIAARVFPPTFDGNEMSDEVVIRT